MSKQDKYFQFPLALLAYGSGNVYNRLEAIMTYGAWLAGKSMREQSSIDCLRSYISDRCKADLPNGFDKQSDEHAVYVAGQKRIGINKGNMESECNTQLKIYSFLKVFTAQNGKSPLCRIKKDLVFEVRDGRGMSYKDFSVLCAVYSMIGSKPYCRITREMVIARAMGYSKPLPKKKYTLIGLLNDREDKQKPMTISQVRTVLDKLNRTWFCRLQASPRCTYYGAGITEEKLSELIVKRITKKEEKRAHELKSRNKFKDLLSAKRAEIRAAKQFNPLPETTIEPRLNDSPMKTTETATESPDNRHYNKSCNNTSIENARIENKSVCIKDIIIKAATTGTPPVADDFHADKKESPAKQVIEPSQPMATTPAQPEHKHPVKPSLDQAMEFAEAFIKGARHHGEQWHDLNREKEWASEEEWKKACSRFVVNHFRPKLVAL